MPSLVKLPLPSGSIGVVVKGTPPTIIRLLEDSPMKGRIKEGYIFNSLIMSDGTTFQNLTTVELAKKLKETSPEEGRKLVMEIGLPPGAEVVLPQGSLGVTVQDVKGKPTITHIDVNSPLRNSLRVGYVVEKVVMEDGTEHSGHSSKEIDALLTHDAESSGRRLSLVNPALVQSLEKKVTLPMEKLVNLPTGGLGIAFKGQPAAITGIKDDSVLKGIVRVGFVVDSLIFPNGTDYVGCSASELSKALQGSSDTEGRKLLLKSPENPDLPSSSAIKVFLPSFGNAKDLGLTFGDDATISQISPSSPLADKISVGQTVVMVHDGKSVTYDTPNGDKVNDAILDSSGSTGRYLMLKG